MALSRTLFDVEHTLFGELAHDFAARHAAPHAEEWDSAGVMPKWVFEEAAKAGVLGFSIPERFGGGGVEDFRFNAALGEEWARTAVSSGLAGITLQNDIVYPYFTNLTNDEQRERWLPSIAAGELVTAIAMTEPGTGSDLAGIQTKAVRDGDEYVINGAKTFISNGQNADLVATAVRTSDDPHAGLSLIVIEADRPGFSRGRNLEKVGLHAQDTSELAFSDVRVPVENLLGGEGAGFLALMQNLPQERLSIAVGSLAAAEGIFERTLQYAKERTAFGRPIGSFQNSRFTLAEIATKLQVTRSFVDDCILAHNAGELSAADAAAAKWWATELHVEIANQCVQLHGGYGYMLEYQVAKDFQDARISTIYGGTTEIMKEIVGRDLGL
jgi:alkylation response protein AidB-like acyl-CoA dehydrogenase